MPLPSLLHVCEIFLGEPWVAIFVEVVSVRKLYLSIILTHRGGVADVSYLAGCKKKTYSYRTFGDKIHFDLIMTGIILYNVF